MNRAGTTPEIVVLAGTNGAGKSSVAGAALRQAGGDYFNPDEVARQLRGAELELSRREANSRAWDIRRDTLQMSSDSTGYHAIAPHLLSWTGSAVSQVPRPDRRLDEMRKDPAQTSDG